MNFWIEDNTQTEILADGAAARAEGTIGQFRSIFDETPDEWADKLPKYFLLQQIEAWFELTQTGQTVGASDILAFALVNEQDNDLLIALLNKAIHDHSAQSRLLYFDPIATTHEVRESSAGVFSTVSGGSQATMMQGAMKLHMSRKFTGKGKHGRGRGVPIQVMDDGGQGLTFVLANLSTGITTMGYTRVASIVNIQGVLMFDE